MGSGLWFGVVGCRQVNAFTHFAGEVFHLDARGGRERPSLVGWSSRLWSGHRGRVPGVRTPPSLLAFSRPPLCGERGAPSATDGDTGASPLVIRFGAWGAAPNPVNVIYLLVRRLREEAFR